MLVPKATWPEAEGSGWIGKIMSVHKTTRMTTIIFKDGKQYFGFKAVLDNFKPLS